MAKNKRNETISGLRQLADWLEAHPEVPVPTYNQNSVAVEAADLPTIARAMGQVGLQSYTGVGGGMSHFTVVVFTEKGEESEVDRLLRPYDENREEDGGWFAEGSRWDWYQIGGRWEGALIGAETETTFKVCFACEGTGIRPGGREQFGDAWFEQMRGCNGCLGTGKIEELLRRNSLDRNAIPVPNIAPEFVPFAFVAPDGKWYERGRMGWFWADNAGRIRARGRGQR